MGKIYLELEKPKKAKEYFEKVLFSSTQYDGEAKAGIALAELKMGNFLEAKQLSTDATNLNPDDVYSKIIYAMAHASALTDDEEEKLFLNAMEAAGQSTFAGRKYVEILLRKNRIKKAEEILKKTMIQNSLDAPSMELYSDISWLKGNSEEAIKYRIDAEQAYRNAGNIIKADQIVRWLNFEAVPNIEIKVIEKPKPQTTRIFQRIQRYSLLIPNQQLFKMRQRLQKSKKNQNQHPTEKYLTLLKHQSQ